MHDLDNFRFFSPYVNAFKHVESVLSAVVSAYTVGYVCNKDEAFWHPMSTKTFLFLGLKCNRAILILWLLFQKESE